MTKLMTFLVFFSFGALTYISVVYASGNEHLNLPVEIKGAQAKAIFDVLNQKETISRNEIKGEHLGDFFYTTRLLDKETGLFCAKVRSGYTPDIDYSCYVRVDRESLLKFLNL